MKVLTVCRMGTVRSVSMAHVLKHKGHDALAVGIDANSPQTIDMLSDWADLILVMQTRLAKGVNRRFKDKVRITDVGEDVWGSARNPELIKRVIGIYKDLRVRGDIT